MTAKADSIIKKCEELRIPYFVLTARDHHSLKAMLKYIEEITTGGDFSQRPCTQEYINDILEITTLFIQWRFAHLTKTPD
jgi:hypothetical protein